MAPVLGVKLAITGGLPTTNGETDVPVPVGATTVIGPVVVPAATVAVIWVAELTTKLAAAVPLKLTDVLPVKLVPAIITTVPARPPEGVKLLIVGLGTVVIEKLTFEISKK